MPTLKRERASLSSSSSSRVLVQMETDSEESSFSSSSSSEGEEEEEEGEGGKVSDGNGEEAAEDRAQKKKAPITISLKKVCKVRQAAPSFLSHIHASIHLALSLSSLMVPPFPNLSPRPLSLSFYSFVSPENIKIRTKRQLELVEWRYRCARVRDTKRVLGVPPTSTAPESLVSSVRSLVRTLRLFLLSPPLAKPKKKKGRGLFCVSCQIQRPWPTVLEFTSNFGFDFGDCFQSIFLHALVLCLLGSCMLD